LPGPFAEAIASWDSFASQGDLFDASKQLSSLKGRPITLLADAAAAVI
jgi:NAD(P)H dehydrogenase (quinone)